MLGLGDKRAKYSPIGLDLGRRGGRLVQLIQRPPSRGVRLVSHWELYKAYCWEWVGDQDSETAGGGGRGNPLERALRSAEGQRALGERLRRVVRQNEFHGRDVVVGLSSPEVEMHALELPVPESGEVDANLRQAAKWELERLLSLPTEDVRCDFWLLPASDAGRARRGKQKGPGGQGGGQPTAIGVAAEGVVVSGVWEACMAAGLVCGSLDAGLCGLSRFGVWLRALPLSADALGDGVEEGGVGKSPYVSATGSAEGSVIWGMLDLGDAQVRLVVCADDVPVVVRSFQTGGERWVRRVAESLELSIAGAEVHLRDHGIAALRRESNRGVRQTGGAAPSAQLGSIIRNILREELDALCGEIERSYRYALQCYPRHRVSDLMLVGGAGELHNLDEYLANKLGIRVYPAARRWDDTVAGRSSGGGKGRLMGQRHSVGSLACAVGLAIPLTRTSAGAAVVNPSSEPAVGAAAVSAAAG